MRTAIILPILAIAMLAIAINAQQQPPTLPQKGSGPGKPLSPQEAQKHFKLDDGLRIELVACEPQVESPVAMQFDPDGRLWVVEMRDYPNGPGKGEKPMGRIRILEDKDGDGFFETSRIWADNLLFANGLLLWKDGAIVTMAPKITHLRDTKGTGKADTENILYTGFAEQNPQLRVSHPNFGPDGWIYCANGLRGGKVVRAPVANAPGSPVVDLSGMDFRFDPVNLDRYEAITGPGQFGNTFDEWGNRFVCDNRHHLRHIVMEQRYIKRNPYLAAPSLLQDISVLDDGPLSSGGKVYPLSKNWTTSSLHEGRFTAACGVFIYHGNLLDHKPAGERSEPAGSIKYRGVAFTCEPTGNLVHMEIMTPKGATFESRPHKKGVEFLATTDDWFRPVFLTHGPEGALYIADMYRAVIEHPDFMPPELKNRPDLWQGKDKGRIWRIVPKDHVTKTPRPGLSKATIPALVKTLEHAEPWHRQTVQRLLLEKNDKAMIEPLTKLLATTKSPHAKILASWMLSRRGLLKESELAWLLADTHPRVVENAIRLGEPIFAAEEADLDRELRSIVVGHLLSGDARVQYQAILSSPYLEPPTASRIMHYVAYASREDRWARLAVQSLNEDMGLLVQELIKRPADTPAGIAQIREHAQIIGAKGHPTYVLESYIALSKQVGIEKWAGLVGLVDGLERRGSVLSKALAGKVNAKDIDRVFADGAEIMRDLNAPAERRQMVARMLSHAPWPTAKQTLLPVIEKDENLELRIAALRAIAAQQDREVPTLLMKLWPGAAPSVRREILEAMLRQPLRVNVLLDEIEAKRLRSSELDPLRTRQLMNHKDAGIRARATKLLANNLPADRAKVLAQYQTALTLKGNAKNGQEIFKKNCATCHRVAGIGIDVGPDIADTRTKTLAAMLNDILAPNSAIDANYVNYVVSTKDGRILTGLLTAETASSITLIRAEKQADVVLRRDVDEIGSTGISLMPEGLEKNISVQEMADLLGFLKNWRYLDGSVPLTP